MRVSTKPGTEPGAVRTLRGLIEWLRASGKLLETETVVDPNKEWTASNTRFEGGMGIDACE
jgi:hypothetical protein